MFTLLLAQGGEFAFVVFQAAAGARRARRPRPPRCWSAPWRCRCCSARCCWWRSTAGCCRASAARQRAQLDEISEPQDAPVIIAGFGRYGQIVGRLLRRAGHRRHRAGPRRRHGRGGARLRLQGVLRRRHAAGPAAHRRRRHARSAGGGGGRHASSRCASSTWRASTSRTCELVARARDVTHWNELRDRGVMRVEREVFESSLRSGRTVLEVLGYRAARGAAAGACASAATTSQLFEQMYPHHKDRAKLIAVVKQGRAAARGADGAGARRARRSAAAKARTGRRAGTAEALSAPRPSAREEAVPHQLEPVSSMPR